MYSTSKYFITNIYIRDARLYPLSGYRMGKGMSQFYFGRCTV